MLGQAFNVGILGDTLQPTRGTQTCHVRPRVAVGVPSDPLSVLAPLAPSLLPWGTGHLCPQQVPAGVTSSSLRHRSSQCAPWGVGGIPRTCPLCDATGSDRSAAFSAPEELQQVFCPHPLLAAPSFSTVTRNCGKKSFCPLAWPLEPLETFLLTRKAPYPHSTRILHLESSSFLPNLPSRGTFPLCSPKAEPGVPSSAVSSCLFPVLMATSATSPSSPLRPKDRSPQFITFC